MKYYTLDKKEKDILNSFEKEEFQSVSDAKKERKRYHSYAHTSLNRTRNINIRLSERDLQKIRAKAAEKGIPYQTLVASIIHQYGSRT